ncbi:MAG: polyprenyl synthetase family protein [Bacteroidales bacterium]|nr:polyprenyl synthetase family protein [Bacteroidales bacterium]
MDINSVKDYLSYDWAKVQETISSALRSDIALLNQVNSAMLANAGKMLRPMLALLIARACAADGKANGDTHLFAAAVELLHNATLFHDDVADMSPERRGHPTLNALMGPQASVLVGDFWLVRAIGCILAAKSGGLEVIAAFSRTLSDLAEGEMLQLQKASSCDTIEEDYFRIIHDKTASLFDVAAYSAAVSVGAGSACEAAVRDFAVKTGLAFQIRDDIFDYTTTMEVGKPLGVDILEQKITMPLLCALSDAPAPEQARIRDMVKHLDGDFSRRDEILEFVKVHDGCAKAQKRLEALSDEAARALDVLPDSRDRRLLQELAVHIAGRTV